MFFMEFFYVSLDLYDTSFHSAGLVLETGEFYEFRSKLNNDVLRKKLQDIFQ